MLFSSFLFVSVSAEAVERDKLNFLETYKNNSAADYIFEKKPERTLNEVSELLEDNPENMLLHYNLGVSLMHLKDIERAKQEFESILKKSENPEARFFSAFNLGYIYSVENRIDDALKMYQEALEYKPDSVETKVNIELLFQGQSGGGGGGEGENEEESEDGDQQDENKPKEYDTSKKPQQFKSKELSKQDVKDILEELEQQEQKIRDKLNQKQSKEDPLGKDW